MAWRLGHGTHSRGVGSRAAGCVGRPDAAPANARDVALHGRAVQVYRPHRRYTAAGTLTLLYYAFLLAHSRNGRLSFLRLLRVPRACGTGYEIMSEPRNKGVAQSAVTDFMREGCEAVHAADPRALCVVGPRPYYKLWELSDAVVQPSSSGGVLYTFDFFVPKNFVM